jgi:hypothetical protein
MNGAAGAASKNLGSIPCRGSDRLWAHPTSYRLGTGGSFPGHEATNRLHLLPSLKYVELYLHAPMRLHVVALNYEDVELYLHAPMRLHVVALNYEDKFIFTFFIQRHFSV